MSRIDMEQVKRSNPIAEVARRHGIELRGQGKRLTARCPFHEDRTPSFCVYPETESFHCFGCGAAGDVIDFIRRTEGLSFREAVLRLGGGAAGGTPAAAHPPPVRAHPPEATDQAPVLSLDDRLILTAACELYHETLFDTPGALRYLDERGVQLWVAKRCRLGTSDGRRLVPYLKRRRLSLKRAGELGLLFRSGDEAMTGRIVIPELRGRALRLDGRPRAGRRRRAEVPRALAPEAAARLRARPATHLFLTEGPFDWLTLTGWGLPACALLGTQPGRGVLRLLERARSVVLVMDNDEAGQRRRAAALRRARRARARCSICPRASRT